MAPAQMKALVSAPDHTTEVKEVSVPKPQAGEVLIKVSTVTLNPTDWKHAAFMSTPSQILGCDFCGTVQDSNGTDLAVGTRVAGFVHGGKYEDRGSFAEYLKARADTLSKAPANVDDAVASSVGIAGYTAAQALFSRLELNLPSKTDTLPALDSNSPKLLVWAGSSSVGQYAVQLGRIAGYHVITTASPKNHEYLRSIGASETYDYRQEALPELISKQHPTLSAALDCISEGGTQGLCARSLGSSGGTVVVLLKPEKEAIEIRNDVKIVHTLVYSVLGHPFAYGKATYDEATVSAENAKMQAFTSQGIFRHLFASGLLRGNVIKHMDGGLSGIPQGFKYMQEGKVSLEKLAYRIG
ncbi:Zinc-binding oxidoreductase [Ceraceosorus bombacis]|uniref:Zinc-binding oxidoreductase n=1 Tax=Ceraceosorus bombacis TaxID=401625 RepID=A0A0P1BP45_9BASI|nr:Zinc-binding oxidoreductase [Ceraceosorus bombacis]